MQLQMNYERQLMKLEIDLREREKQIGDFHYKINEKTKDYEEKFIYLTNEISIKDDRIRMLENDINELNNKKREEYLNLNQIQCDYESFISKSNRKTMELKIKFENELKNKEELIANLQNKIIRLENELKDKDKLIMDLQTRVDEMTLELNGKIKFMNLIILNQDNKLKEYEVIVEESKRRLMELDLYKEKTSDLEYLGDRLKSTEKHNQTLEEKLKKVQLERDELQHKYDEIQVKLATVSDQLDHYQVKDRVQQSEIKRLKSSDSDEMAKLIADKQELQQELIDLNNNFVQFKSKSKEDAELLSNENSQLKNELAVIHSKLETLNADYLRSSKNLIDALSENKKLRIDFENQIYRLNEDKEALEAKYEQELKEKDDCIKKLELKYDIRYCTYIM
jgi:chromosome segregation ATPase